MRIVLSVKRQRASKAANGARQDLLTGGVTFAAIVMFLFTGSAVMPAAVRTLFTDGDGTDRVLVTALLLNLALILFGWRRCHDLEKEIRQRRDAEQQARLLASRDPLTGFLNRRSLAEAAADLFATPQDRSATFLLIDLDHFKDVNDLHGHAVGDGLLQWVAAAILDCVPEDALCTRLGGDEFGILLLDETAMADQAAATAGLILERLAKPVEIDGIFTHAGASIGLATRETGDGIDELLRHADLAMYEAKKKGRARFAWFDLGMDTELQRRSRVEAGIRAGIPAGQFVPYFEQVVDLETGDTTGFEVLARWHHPIDGVIEPGEFIPVAETCGLISELSASIIREALIQARRWDEKLTISVNISPMQVRDPLLPQRLLQLLVETRFPARRLEVEITESALFENIDIARATLESLKNQGIRIALDDFGTGYSSLAHIQSLPFDRIKIDRSFVGSMAENPESLAIVGVIAKLGATLGIPITGEGIEDAATREMLRSVGCSSVQGWFFGRAMPGEAVSSMLEQRSRVRPGHGEPDMRTAAAG